MNKVIERRSPDIAEFHFTSDTVREFLYLPFDNRMAVLNALISKKQVMDIIDVTDLPKTKFLELLGLSSAALHYRQYNDLYALPLSGAILAIVDVYSCGYRHAKDIRAFNDWMLEGKFYNDLPPVAFCSHQLGRLEIIQEIGRLKKNGNKLFNETR